MLQGIFTLYKNNLVNDMQERLKFNPEIAKKVNERIVNILLDSYIISASKNGKVDFLKIPTKTTPGSLDDTGISLYADIKESTKLSSIVISTFLDSLYYLYQNGKIPSKIFDPIESMRRDSEKKDIPGFESWIKNWNSQNDKLGNAAKVAGLISSVIALAALINAIKK